MHIQRALIGTNTYKDLLKIVENATPGVTYSGCRYITVKGYEGELPINALIQQFDDFRFRKRDLDAKEAKHKVYDLIPKIHKLSDVQVNKCNFITYYLTQLRDFFRICVEGGKGFLFPWEDMTDRVKISQQGRKKI
ncbi:MAG: hypothetical protein KR126chlam3_01709 [Chlamydiae bacterium]|nr:hypothetical protein [Chlamydiota bacterium]